MGVYIKNVEMPTDHPLWIVVHSDGTVEANEVSASRPVGWQTLQNAAVPVPPHGDLIDRDELKHKIGQLSTAWEYGQGVSDCWKALIAAPTVIEAEEGE